VLGAGLSGCAGTWDELSRKDIPIGQRFSNLFHTPDPLVVLRDSEIGDERARALRSLKEPAAHGGSDHDQEYILKILVTAARSDPHPVCRVAAIQSLGRFRDPRAAQALIDAFFDVPNAAGFSSESIAIVQVAALTAMGQTRHPATVDTLARVVREPVPSFDVPQEEKQHDRDRRIAAIRALGNFSHYQATEALVHVLKQEKDAGLRMRAHESLVNLTGKDLPPDGAAWEAMFQQAPPEKRPENRINLAGWLTLR
jgi:hypothetical protein